MTQEPFKVALENFLDFLLPYGIHTVLNALMVALSEWLNVYYPVESAQASRVQALVEYERWVGQTITAGQYQRRTLPPHTPLPYPYRDRQIELSFAQKVLGYLHGMPGDAGVRFLGTLNGAWMLSCPEVIIRNAPEFATSIEAATTEADLIFLLGRQLSLYLH